MKIPTARIDHRKTYKVYDPRIVGFEFTVKSHNGRRAIAAIRSQVPTAGLLRAVEATE